MALTVAEERSEDTVRIAGAGPAGLVAAITLARRRVIVHEVQREVGYRFQSDLQGLENWSSGEDVLDLLRGLGIDTDFDALPCDRGWGFDAWGERYDMIGKKTLFYMVERGPGPRTLDTALLDQARTLGVELYEKGDRKR